MALVDSLISYWALGEASGSRADSHGANTLSDNNTVTQAAGKIGNAAQFAAANSEYLSIADNAALSTGDIDFTLAAWCYLDSLVNGVIASKYTLTGNQREYNLFYNHDDHGGGTAFSFGVSPDGTSASVNSIDATSFGAPSTATWYYVVGWHDAAANTINVQVNNGTINSVAHTTGVFDSTAAFLVGQLSGFYFWNGRIDELGFWKRVLTTQERTDLYNGGAGLAYPFGAGSLLIPGPRMPQAILAR